MQTKNLKPLVLLLLLACSAAFSSFTSRKGGDIYEIYLDNTLLLQQFPAHPTGANSFSLDQGNSNSKLEVRYSHCGVSGKSRHIMVKDGQNNMIKEWQFPDAAPKSTGMSFTVKEILNLQRPGATVLNLYYSSKELPDGKWLASIHLANSIRSKP